MEVYQGQSHLKSDAQLNKTKSPIKHQIYVGSDCRKIHPAHVSSLKIRHKSETGKTSDFLPYKTQCALNKKLQ